MNKIKILHLLPSLEFGGMENALVNLINGLDEQVFENVIYCFDSLREDEPLRKKIRSESINIYSSYKGDRIDWFLPLKLRTILRKEAIDIIHTRDWAATFYGTLAAKLTGVRVIADIRGRIPPVEGQKLKKFSHFISAIVAVSNDIKTLLSSEYGLISSKITTIHNGIDISRYNGAGEHRDCRAEFGFAPDDFIIGTIGRMEPVKDYGTLLTACAPPMQQNPHIRCLMVGDGSERERLQGLAAELGIDARVTFTGFREDVNPILRTMNLFLLTSISEGISNVLLEAMASGLPVIASDVGGTPEIISHEKNGILVPARNVELLSEQIRLLSEDPNRQRMLGNNARESIRSAFSFSKMIAEYSYLYAQTLGN
ncbi:glycosyltransferase [candidate division KSB1 bacterium]|nr:glycosyltransferase [candidate division KSB1 bacterium]